MYGAMIEFMLRGSVFLAVFLAGAFFLFRHVQRVKQKYGAPNDQENYMKVLKHYFFRD